MVKKIAVIGAGSWGTALSVLLANKGMTVKLWVHGKHVHHQIAVARKYKIPSGGFDTRQCLSGTGFG